MTFWVTTFMSIMGYFRALSTMTIKNLGKATFLMIKVWNAYFMFSHSPKNIRVPCLNLIKNSGMTVIQTAVSI